MPYQPQNTSVLNGLNEDENPASLLPGQLREATNAARLGNLTGTRPGLVRDTVYDANITSNPAVQGIHEFRQGRDDGRQLVVVANGKVYRTEDTEVTSSSPTITAGAQYLWSFANHQSLMYAAGGASGDSIWTWDGNTSNAATARLAGLGLRPKYVFAKFGVLFLAGFQNGTDFFNNPLVARYSNYGETTTDETSWPTSNCIPGELLGENPGVGAYGGEEVSTGLASYQDNRGDFLLFLTSKRILAFKLNPNVTSNANRFIQTDAIANGCVSQHAFVDLGYDQGDAVYVSRHGVHSIALSQQYGNRENTFLSYPIRKTWETVNQAQLERITATYWPDEGMVLFAVPTGSNTTPDTILCMDIKGAGRLSPESVRWYKWKLAGSLSPNYLRMARLPTSNEEVVYLGGSAGHLGHFSRTSYADFGSAYPVSFRTKDDDFGFPSIEKGVGNAFVMANGSGDYLPTHTYMLDDASITGVTSTLEMTLPGFELGDTSTGDTIGTAAADGTLGSGENLIRDRVRGVGSGFTIAHKFMHAGNNEPFFIGSITQDVAVRGMADEAA